MFANFTKTSLGEVSVKISLMEFGLCEAFCLKTAIDRAVYGVLSKPI